MANLNATKQSAGSPGDCGESNSSRQARASINPLIFIPLETITAIWFYVPGLCYRCGVPRPEKTIRVLEDCFSFLHVSKRLAKQRISLAKKRHDKHFLYNLNIHNPSPDPKGDDSKLTELLPPRRKWRRPSHEKRLGKTSSAITENSIIHAIQKASKAEDWHIKLTNFHREIFTQVCGWRKPHFKISKVTLVPKDETADPPTFRPISTFNLSDQVIIGIAAKYLRSIIDPLLTGSSYAFRCGSHEAPPLAHHDAVDDLIKYIMKHQQKILYVAECDIQKFFDSVSHNIAKRELDNLLKILRKNRTFYDKRILKIFNGYLDAYTFQSTVQSFSQKQNKKVPWVEKELRQIYEGNLPRDIGVPQGGALSPVIANIVLHSADIAVQNEARRWGRDDYFYGRYCDDMVIASPNQEFTAALYKSYLNRLEELKLPYHPPKEINQYSSKFFEEKSKEPYPFGSLRLGGVSPWLAFLGYHIRYDGTLRIRKASITKEIEKQKKLYIDVIKSASKNGVRMRVTKQQALHRVRQRLIAMSVGRVDINLHGPITEHEMCWVSGFKLLKSHKHICSQIKVLDRTREHFLYQLKKRLPKTPLPTNPPQQKSVYRYYGRPFSYFDQFDF